jgi:hypothetical protein
MRFAMSASTRAPASGAVLDITCMHATPSPVKDTQTTAQRQAQNSGVAAVMYCMCDAMVEKVSAEPVHVCCCTANRLF